MQSGIQRGEVDERDQGRVEVLQCLIASLADPLPTNSPACAVLGVRWEKNKAIRPPRNCHAW